MTAKKKTAVQEVKRENKKTSQRKDLFKFCELITGLAHETIVKKRDHAWHASVFFNISGDGGLSGYVAEVTKAGPPKFLAKFGEFKGKSGAA